MKQWEAIHANLAKVFYYDPPLKDRTMENYVKEHLPSTRIAWKKVWLAKGNVGRPNKCPIHVWESLVQYWKTPNAQQESKQMQGICGHVQIPHTHGWWTLYHATQLEVSRTSRLSVMHPTISVYIFLCQSGCVCVCACACVVEINIRKYVM